MNPNNNTLLTLIPYKDCLVPELFFNQDIFKWLNNLAGLKFVNRNNYHRFVEIAGKYGYSVKILDDKIE